MRFVDLGPAADIGAERGVHEHGHGQHRQLAAVVAQLDKAIAALQALMAGTQQPAVLSAIGKLNAAKQKFGAGAAAIRSAIDDTDKYNAVR
jgi:hypothetical protein